MGKNILAMMVFFVTNLNFYSKVYKASNSVTKELVALKRIRMESERDGVRSMSQTFFFSPIKLTNRS